jgi:YjbE family integral membrane protein
MSFDSTDFWIALLQIIGVNIVLSGDNAVVIALAARGLPAEQQKRAVAWGSGAAVIMRIVLTVVAVELLRLPYLKLIGAALLAYIAVKLLIPEGDEEGHGAGATGMGAAIRTILLADLVMSLDNVIAVAAAAKGNIVLLVIGLAISIPLVVFASRLLLGLMERFPVIITIGAALLGWVAGEMLIGDPVVKPMVDAGPELLHYVVPALGAVLIVVIGKFLAARATRAEVEITAPAASPPPSVTPAAATMRVVTAVDGSPASLAAVRYVIGLPARLRAGIKLEVDLVNVQRGLSGDVASFVSREALQDYHRERSDQALAPARKLFDAAGIGYTRHQFVGEPGRVIAGYAAQHGASEIVMGTRGLGTHTGAVVGSVAHSTLEHATVPVVVVK